MDWDGNRAKEKERERVRIIRSTAEKYLSDSWTMFDVCGKYFFSKKVDSNMKRVTI